MAFFLVNQSLTATFIQVALGKGSGLTTFPAIAVIVVAIALSWLGLRSAAALAWPGLLAFSIVSAMMTNYSWGLAGFGFVACGFCGILLQTPLNPNLLLAELVSEYGPRRGALAGPAQSAGRAGSCSEPQSSGRGIAIIGGSCPKSLHRV